MAFGHLGLSILRLCSNELGATGASALAEGLRHGRLRQLFASGNGLGPAGATALASALREDRELQVLDASWWMEGRARETYIIIYKHI